MVAKKEVSAQQRPENREDLSNILPLDTPLSMQIELSSACNFKCKFCIHGNDALKAQGQYSIGNMKYDLFTKIVNDISEFSSKIKFISLQSRGESFLNPELARMIRYLKAKNVTEKIGINTNASLLSESMNLAIIDAGIDIIRISIEGVNAIQYKEVAGVDIEFDKMIENLRHLYLNKKQCHIFIKIIDCGMTDEDKDTFYKLFSDSCDAISIENPVDAWADAGLDKVPFKDERYGLETSQCQVCPRIFFSYVVHFDGTVVACDHDWNEQYPIGNANLDHMVGIWNGEPMQMLRRKHLNKEASKIRRCSNCINLKSGLDNIDKEAERLIKYY